MYLYAWTIQYTKDGVNATHSGLAHRDEPISGEEDYLSFLDEIRWEIGFDGGVLLSLNLLHQTPCVEDEREKFAAWYTQSRGLVSDADLTQYDECFALWRCWKAAKGIKSKGAL